jgi:hypothetical protein
MEAKYHETGTEVFPPFTCLTTIGTIFREKGQDENDSEYKQAVRYGRPLFVVMDERDKLTKNTHNILQRMLLVPKGQDWMEERSTWLNILATRIQMGQVSTSIASDLIARGYANLCSYDNGTAQICYFPDPVCARLAMCLMKEGWTCPGHPSDEKITGMCRCSFKSSHVNQYRNQKLRSAAIK